MTSHYGLSVRFTLKDGAGEAFDQLVEETLTGIKASEPGTLVYVTHQVEGEPNQRIFYELYRDVDAFEAHEQQPHTRRFLAERAQYIASIEVDRLTLLAGKGYEQNVQ